MFIMEKRFCIHTNKQQTALNFSSAPQHNVTMRRAPYISIQCYTAL